MVHLMHTLVVVLTQVEARPREWTVEARDGEARNGLDWIGKTRVTP
jgi:hypothetical protein